VPGRLSLRAQPHDSLGVRLEAALGDLLTRGNERVCVVGSDSPTLPVRRIEEAFAALESAEFVLVPAVDGGFVLLGARRCPHGLLAGIEWSTDRVYAQAHDRLSRYGSVS